jgi:membrane protein
MSARSGLLQRVANDPRVGAFLPTARRLGRHELIDRSAALTYYGILALVPGVLVVFSLIGLLGTQDTVNEVLKVVREIGPGDSEGPLRQPLEDLVKSDTRSGTILGVGLVGVLWTASAYVGSFFRASATVWNVGARPVWHAWPARMALTIAILLLLSLALLVVVVTGKVATSVGDAIGFQSQIVSLYNVFKWPLLLTLLVLVVSVLYRASPSRPRSATKWLLTPGGAFAVVAWVLLSVGYNVYADLFASYGTAYGALGTTVATIVWLWLTNLVLLMGVEADAELEIWKAGATGAPSPPAAAPPA